MKKLVISKLFLYRHRFVIGYLLLGLAFIGLLFIMPTISPNGLSENEMSSVVDSSMLGQGTLSSGDITDLPYHALQNISIHFLGLNSFAIKLPSIIIGILLGLFLILLLNRWFKNNVALIASILTVLSAPFLYLAGSGTPLIMLVFWPTVLLWLGSKIQGKTLPRTIYSFIFAICLMLAIFTPYMIYLVTFIVIYAFAHPHLRFTIKRLPRVPFVLTTILVLAAIGLLGYNLVIHPDVASKLFLTENFDINTVLPNLSQAFLPFFSWTGAVESVFLSPMIGVSSIALAFIGLASTAKGFFASRNSIATLFLVFTILLSGVSPDSAVLIILPLAILTAHGIRYILEKWYNLFPENPYARIFGLIPIGTLLGIMIISSISHFTFGYRYNPSVAHEFNDDLSLIYQKLPEDTTLLIPAGTLNYDFYKILEQHTNYSVISTITKDDSISHLATLGRWSLDKKSPYKLSRIITSSKSTESDRIYIYTDN